jgi:hypothetical protein
MQAESGRLFQSHDDGGIWTLLLLLVIGIALFYGFTLREGHAWGDDFSQYLLHARNIAEGRSYNDIHFIRNPLHFIAPQAYPPLVPLVLAPVYYFFGLDLTAMKLAQLACFCLALLVIGRLFGRSLSTWCVLVVITLFALNPYVWNQKDIIQSEYLFLLFSFLALLLMELHYNRGTAYAVPGIGLLLGVTMYLAYGTREIGVVLPLTLVGYEIIALRRITGSALVAVAVFLILALLQKDVMSAAPIHPLLHEQLSALAAGEGMKEAAHISILRFDLAHISRQVVRYGESIKDYWSGDYLASWVVAILATLLAVVGYARRLLLRISTLEIYTTGYLAVIFLFAGFQGIRYLLPVIPLYLYYAFVGIQFSGRLLGRRVAVALVAIVLICAGIVYLDEYRKQDFNVIVNGISAPDAVAMFDYINNTAGPGDIIVFRKPRVMALLTNRDSSVYPPNYNPPLLLRYLDVLGAAYVVTGHFEMDGRTLKPVIGEYPDRFLPVFSSGDFTVYRYLSAKVPS